MKIAAVLLIAPAALAAADPAFILETRSPRPYTPAYLGNGAIGLSTSVSGAAPTNCFLAGIYDHAPGDVPRIAAVPAWNEVDVYNGGGWLSRAAADGGEFREYRQALDMYDGVLRTEYNWTSGNHTVHLRIETFVSRADPALGVVRLELTPRDRGPLRVKLSLRAWPSPRRYPLEQLQKLESEAAKNQQAIWYPGHMIAERPHAEARERGGSLDVLSHPEGAAGALSEAVSLRWPRDLDSPRISTSPQHDAVEIEFQGRAGRAEVFEKFAVLMPSFRGESLISAAIRKANDAAARGYASLLAESANAWHELWRSDIVAEGDRELQTAIHSMEFYLLGSARADSDFSIPPMGLSTAGYYGHIFWDADTYMFPPLLLLHPDLARPIIMFRSRTLDAARANARRNGYRGAMYPWEAGPDGAETTPRFAYQNALYENHVNGDVALAAWNYYLATGDRSWLERYGYPIIHDTADFWTSRVQYDREHGRYEIGKVVSVNESLIGVNNDPYTNATAKKNLELAMEAAKALGLAADPKWAEVARKLYLPETALVLIDYPLEFSLNADQRRKIADAALSHPPRGAMMSSEFEPILGVELRDRTLVDRLLPRTWRPYVRPPFNVLPETPTNDNINFITGAGAFLQQFLFGYPGLRFAPEGLEKRYPPLLPASIRKLELRGAVIRGSWRDFVIQNGTIQ